ncbi:hypothetical protein BDV24DRAFT_162286 [Aspergillus arachidicola]|uniref:Aminotransferase class I/classII domain-containing protein n=1 Tax=Aspergillus arachidicola TaxID=656916 RepID=A0A5N6YB96_9EURO|nr:hypothetical protein BDV24DRAFT_162286 [Aspergillus arachidicola]
MSCVREGYTGMVRSRGAMATQLDTHFNPEDITFAAGVSYLNEASALILFDPDQNDAIMLGRPVYGVFARNLAVEANINLEYVSFGDTDQSSQSTCG